MDSVWDEYADEWDSEESTRSYALAAFASLSAVAQAAGIELNGARVVDFGCGTGLLVEHLVHCGSRVVGVDTSQAMLRILEAKVEQNHWSEVTTTTDLDDVPGDNDFIVCSSVCSFLDDYPATAAQLVGLLRPGGLFVQWDWERTDDHDHGLTRQEIRDALRAAGLEAIGVATAFEVEADGQTMRPLIGHGRRTAQA